MARPHIPRDHNKKNGKRKGPRKRESRKLNIQKDENENELEPRYNHQEQA